MKEISNKDDEYIALLGNVKIENKNQNFNLQTTVRYCNFDVGDILTFEGNLYSKHLIVANRINTSI